MCTYELKHILTEIVKGYISWIGKVLRLRECRGHHSKEQRWIYGAWRSLILNITLKRSFVEYVMDQVLNHYGIPCISHDRALGVLYPLRVCCSIKYVLTDWTISLLGMNTGPIFYHWMSTIWASDGRCYICNSSSHLQSPGLAVDRKRIQPVRFLMQHTKYTRSTCGYLMGYRWTSRQEHCH